MSRENDGSPRAAGASKVGSPGEGNDRSIVRHSTDNVTGLRRYPTAYASLYAPCGRRTRWWCAYLCPYCGGGHFARLKSEGNAQGVRRSGCGRLIWLVPEDITAEAVSA